MLRCPHCDKLVNLVKATIQQTDRVDFSNYCLPKTWGEYSGLAISDVEMCDPDYIDQLLEQDTPRIVGLLREALEFFVNKRGSPLEPPR